MTSALGQDGIALDALRVSLRTAGYTAKAIRDATSAAEAVASPRLAPTVAYLQADGDDPLAALVRLFWLGAPAARDNLERLLPETDVDRLTAAGVLAVDGDRVRAELRIDDVFGLLIASDIDHDRDDWVVGVSPSTRLAATHTPRVRARAALDVGAGQGLHALLAARHSDRVVATDFNPRALWMTELNARLNEIDNVETRQGSFLEPVGGERFDLVVINPPYVVSPDARFLYRDGGLEGDAVSRTLLGDLPDHLEDGGFGVLQGNWIHAADERWFTPIEHALEGSACDAAMVRISTAEALEYAAGWNEAHHDGDPDGFARVIREWVDHFQANGIERVSGAMVVLRRRSEGRNWRRAVSLARHPERLGDERLAELFAAQDRLAGLDDDALLAMPLRTPAELRVERYERPGEKQFCVLDLDEALGVRRPVPPHLADAVLQLDGSAPLRDVAGAAGLLEGLRALIKLGFVRLA